MGSDRRSKDEKEKRRRSSPSDSEDEVRIKRRIRSDREATSEKNSSKSSSKKEKKDRSSSKHHSRKEKKSKDRRKSKHDGSSKLEFKEISPDDYFLRNNEFSTWLKEEKDIFFSDLSSERARELFLKFVKDWNRQKLEPRFYEGIAAGPRSAHNWKIKQ
ncbi:style cell-cycle inhibitor 1-B [Impatiens glandulifera]|uniref:style cell-cycle inhibitor 1-B n=1 Tax=Impatiens glandulifera TaxID=253017 RepID=UPI001FB0A820|nr:style cell-cycle inhibitor 1-B [Impatiens glandulifera]